MGEEDKPQEQDRRITRLEAEQGAIQRTLQEIKTMITDLGRELKEAFVPRGELEERFRAVAERAARLESRVRDLEAALEAVKNRPAAPAIPPWTAALVGVVGSLLGALVTMALVLAGLK